MKRIHLPDLVKKDSVAHAYLICNRFSNSDQYTLVFQVHNSEHVVHAAFNFYTCSSMLTAFITSAVALVDDDTETLLDLKSIKQDSDVREGTACIYGAFGITIDIMGTAIIFLKKVLEDFAITVYDSDKHSSLYAFDYIQKHTDRLLCCIEGTMCNDRHSALHDAIIADLCNAVRVGIAQPYTVKQDLLAATSHFHHEILEKLF